MKKEEALSKIEELKKCIEEMDKPKPRVRAYIKEWDELPELWSDKMDFLPGTVVDVVGISTTHRGGIKVDSCGTRLNGETWTIFGGEYIIVEGSLDDLE